MMKVRGSETSPVMIVEFGTRCTEWQKYICGVRKLVSGHDYIHGDKRKRSCFGRMFNWPVSHQKLFNKIL
jgi:hypothetical protein